MTAQGRFCAQNASKSACAMPEARLRWVAPTVTDRPGMRASQPGPYDHRPVLWPATMVRDLASRSGFCSKMSSLSGRSTRLLARARGLDVVRHVRGSGGLGRAGGERRPWVQPCVVRAKPSTEPSHPPPHLASKCGAAVKGATQAFAWLPRLRVRSAHHPDRLFCAGAGLSQLSVRAGRSVSKRRRVVTRARRKLRQYTRDG